MSDQNQRPAALVEVTNAKQLRIMTCTPEGVPIEIGISFTAVEAQKFAMALDAMWIRGNEWRAGDQRKASFMATYRPGQKPEMVVRLTDADKRRAAKGSS